MTASSAAKNKNIQSDGDRRTPKRYAQARGQRNRRPAAPVLVDLATRSWPRNRGDVAEEDLLLFLVDDDARRHHDHEALGIAAPAHVAEQTIQIRNLAQDRRSRFVAAFRHDL